ncbi:hypothetical protein AMJ85_11600 [candidate division BRC1 bacterium SM23_51]|nr:MAG: hypothetical protein AMJ85_11600 [candidate division BRC1 bacterium SM23_51]
MQWLKQSTAASVMLGPAVDNSDGYTPETGLTIAASDCRLSKNGGVFAAKNDATAASTAEFGWYNVEFDATDTGTVGRLLLAASATGALPMWREFMVVPSNTYDSLVAGTDNLDAEVATMAASSITASAFDAGAVDAAAIATGAIGADAIAASAIGTSELATSAADAIADEVWDEVLSSGAHTTLFSAGKRLQNAVLRGGTAISGCPAAIEFPGPWSATDGIYEQNIVSIVDGTGAGQTRLIIEYDGTNKLAYVDRPWHVEPDATSEIELLPYSAEIMADHGLAQAGAAGTITLDAGASATNDIYIGSVVFIATGTGAGQVRLITDYDGSSKVATISDNWTTNPDSTSAYKLFPVGRVVVDSFKDDSITAGAVAAAGANKIADHTIRRTFENACDSSDGDAKAFRSLLGAIGKQVNKVAVSGGTLTVYEDDDSTSLGTQTVSTTPGADPITTLDTD